MSLPHPQHFYADLTSERLETIAAALLDIRFGAVRELDSPYDDTYTRETTAFGRSRNKLIEMCKSGEHDWLTLASPAMDITFRIGQVPCRFFRDDHEAPEKAGFFKRNHVDDLFEIDDNHPVMWRFIVEKALTDEDEDRVFFSGYNAYQEKVSEWMYASSSPVLHSVDSETPPAREIPPAQVDVREDEAGQHDKAQNE
ncbi:hypothetical protein [Azomonas macrocytogenes]|uniref:Uncharacterized protein n=1 Tax=Azomonas macrocytogenes TaxID=69962 RepID=A0A839T2L6_AZOMA|nr:hypothetical protein [Azomonas macrocytogenes]MBB3103781.1 hypothetical protein [Azomonas macrocytogenes]